DRSVVGLYHGVPGGGGRQDGRRVAQASAETGCGNELAARPVALLFLTVAAAGGTLLVVRVATHSRGRSRVDNILHDTWRLVARSARLGERFHAHHLFRSQEAVFIA